jgi:phosphate transport system substrate-binding protein
MMGNRICAADRGWSAIVAVIATLTLGIAGCGGGSGSDESPAGGSNLSGTIRIDGSSIVAPLTEAVARDFEDANPGVTVLVGVAGTGAGFHALCDGHIDITDAAWAMDPEARRLCREAGVAYTGAPVAAQALVVLVNEGNPIDCLMTRHLENIWDPESKISRWTEIPAIEEEFDEKLVLFAPAGDTGTLEFFTEATDGVAGGTRTDYTKADGDALVAGVAGAPGGMGYLNLFAYADSNDSVKALEVDSGKGCVAPSFESAQDGSYALLSRRSFLYLDDAALKKPIVKAFVDYYLETADDLAESFRLVPLTQEQLEATEAMVDQTGAR